MSDSLSIKDEKLSPFCLNLLFFWFLTSAFVVWEPAPFDLLFPVVGFFLLTQSRPLQFPKESRILFPSLLLFLLANLISLFFVEDIERALFYVTVTFYMLLLTIFISLLIMNFGYAVLRHLFLAYTSIAVISAILATLGIIKLLPSSFINTVTLYDRGCGFFKDPNVYAPYLVIPMIYSLHCCFNRHRIRILWGIAALALILGIFTAFSRASWGASAVAVVGYFFLISLAEGRFTLFLKYMGYVFLLLAISGTIVATFASETNLSSFMTRRFAIQDYDSDRFAVQRAALESGLNHPFGIGPGHAERIFEKEALRHTGATHSLYLRVFSETGILGALSFLAILFVTIRKSLLLCFKGIKQHRRLHCALAAALGATLVNSFVIDSLHWRHLFILIGIIWGVDIYNLWHRARES